MKKFLAKIPATMSTGLDLMHYGPASGYIDKFGDQRECKVMQDTRIWCKSAESRDAVLQRLSKVAKEIETNDPGAYTFLVTKSLDTDDEARLYTRFKDRDAMEKHLRRPEIH